jgi:alpha-tubulin suppressor-like RCC1 family protein
MLNIGKRSFLFSKQAAESVIPYYLYSFGYNGNGQLGLGNTTNATTPQKVGSDLWISATCGGYFAGGIKSDGTLWTWGTNGNGQLGLGDTTQRNSPTQVGSDTWKFVSFGDESSFGIKSDGTLWSWGLGSNGILGLGNTTSYNTPQQVGSDSDWKYVSSSWRSTAAIKENGDLYVWGYNGLGNLGLGDTTQRTSPVKLGSDSWNYVSLSAYYGLGIKSDGTLWAWGYNDYGQLGLGNYTSYNTPQQVGSDTWLMVDVNAENLSGKNSSVGIKTDGTLWGWGWNESGELGLGNTTPYNTPQQVGSDTNWNRIGLFGDFPDFIHAIATKTDGTIWSWGKQSTLNPGALGLGNSNSYTTPQQIGSDTDWGPHTPGYNGFLRSYNFKAS